ncbi:MAG TPA: elongation factor P maturation arginine rhamnosyltransferase EarP [Aquabacterium sp.]|nr:elongation factor P maturation arginine rhamnosyltransferase EarP [Aquabacterium sp.]HQC96390.1 elongation factor P maturation arginine rhamnosyltransferase EarP [Aquabacterium sp.]
MQGWRWDVFCRVIDNFGDVGVSWRLCSALAARGHAVRLWIDDASALAWMAPGGAAGVTVHAFDDASAAAEVGDVVVETFGCDPPPAFVAAMAGRPVPPVWINLEYLSAEPYVERSHGLRSPQFSGPGAGLDKWFFYPGFTAHTGGLLQHPPAPDAAEARAWVAAQGWAPAPGERGVLLFGYASPALPDLIAALAAAPALLWVPPGSLQDQQAGLALPAGLRVQPLPWLPSTAFDRLLQAADLRLVRGEDSFVRAQLLGDAPLLWQIYPQDDGAHGPKLDAWLDLQLAGAAPGLAAAVRRAHVAINGLAPGPFALPDATAWAARHQGWQTQLRNQPDLVTQLLAFVETRKRAISG